MNESQHYLKLLSVHNSSELKKNSLLVHSNVSGRCYHLRFGGKTAFSVQDAHTYLSQDVCLMFVGQATKLFVGNSS